MFSTFSQRQAILNKSVLSYPQPVLKNVVLLEKLTRWEVLCHQVENPNEIAQMKQLFPGMFETYMAHTVAINHVLYLLRDVYGLQVEHLKAQSQDKITINPLDAIIAAGGDGTYLEAASLIGSQQQLLQDQQTNSEHIKYLNETNDKQTVEKSTRSNNPIWLFGINTDPCRSEGNLSMKPDPSTILRQLRYYRNFMSSRRHHSIDIPINFTQEHIRYQDPVLLQQHKSKKLDIMKRSKSYKEFSTESEYTDLNNITHVQSGQMTETLAGLRQVIDKLIHNNYIPLHRRRIRVTIHQTTEPNFRHTGTVFRNEDLTLCDHDKSTVSSVFNSNGIGDLCSKTIAMDMHLLNKREELSSSPKKYEYLAVNDILISSLQSHMSSYIEWKIDDSEPFRSKNSGVLVCTGSGSSAWAYNVSKISEHSIDLVIEQFLSKQLPHVKRQLIPVNSKDLCASINRNFIFDPSEPIMRLVVREPIDNRVFSTTAPSVSGKYISLKPLTNDAMISIDGIKVIPLQFGQEVTLEIKHFEDCIFTAV